MIVIPAMHPCPELRIDADVPGLRLDAGCQRQITRDVFDARLSQTHSGNRHEREYRAALA